MNRATRSNKWWGLTLGIIVVLLVIQLVPIDRDNPPIQADFGAPAEIDAILRRACYDCHSNETRWPWYARVAPVSWAMAHDVEEGRVSLNYSLCGGLPDEVMAQLRQLTWEYIEAGSMPPRAYVWLHPEATLTEEDLTRLQQWSGN